MLFGIILSIIWCVLIIRYASGIASKTTQNEIDINDISEVTFEAGPKENLILGKIKIKQNKIRKILISKSEFQASNLQEILRKLHVKPVEL